MKTPTKRETPWRDRDYNWRATDLHRVRKRQPVESDMLENERQAIAFAKMSLLTGGKFGTTTRNAAELFGVDTEYLRALMCSDRGRQQCYDNLDNLQPDIPD